MGSAGFRSVPTDAAHENQFGDDNDDDGRRGGIIPLPAAAVVVHVAMTGEAITRPWSIQVRPEHPPLDPGGSDAMEPVGALARQRQVGAWRQFG